MKRRRLGSASPEWEMTELFFGEYRICVGPCFQGPLDRLSFFRAFLFKALTGVEKVVLSHPLRKGRTKDGAPKFCQHLT